MKMLEASYVVFFFGERTVEPCAVESKNGAVASDDVPRCMKMDEREFSRSVSLSNRCRRRKQKVSLIP